MDTLPLKRIFMKEEGGRRLRNWCDGVMSKDAVSNKQDLDNASKYCGIKNIKQQLERLGVKVFEEGDSDWQSVYTKRKNENSSASTFEEIKKWCFSTRNKDFVAFKMSTDYADVLRYCTDKGKVDGIHTKSIEISSMTG
ncbi:hypothetical protein MHF_1360 [Mycoplasma haemofelis Ohio2]|uniref:Uncharacterized protein n=1 Tax=Mycoplasma haemofelis (strain Ohio2) TaxID=859194 RepID=F6FG98_MYCHI|nr:hypothetical protein MHF_1360 [Mycoplasma haemofelis Ohio2]